MSGVSPVGGAAHQGTAPPAPAAAGQGAHILLVQFKDLEVLSNAVRRSDLGITVRVLCTGTPISARAVVLPGLSASASILRSSGVEGSSGLARRESPGDYGSHHTAFGVAALDRPPE